METGDGQVGRKYELAIGAFIAAMAGFFLLLSICAWMEPSGLWANHGFSYYGDLPETLLPYRLAFFVAGVFTLLSALLLPNVMPVRVIKLTLLGMIPFLFALVITTTTGHPRISALHVRIGTALFVLLFVVACWLALGAVRDRFNAACLLIQSAGGVISWLALRAVIPCLIQGQVVFELAFGGLVLHTLIVLRANMEAGRPPNKSGA